MVARDSDSARSRLSCGNARIQLSWRARRSVFFVISGFLITYLLINDQLATGKVSLKNFYIRRAVRILPAYLAFVAALFLLTRVTFLELSQPRILDN